MKGLTERQHAFLVDFLHPVDRAALTPAKRFARQLFHHAAVGGARLLGD